MAGEREREQCIYEENERSKKIMEGDEGKYTSLRLLIEPGQEKRIIRALKSDRKGCVIYVRKIGKKNNANDDDAFLSSASIANDDSKLDGNHPTRGVLHLTDRHLKKYHNADAGDRVGLNFDRRELEYNRKTGGFLPFLLPLLGAIAAGATTSLVDNALSKKGSGVVPATSSSSPVSSTQRPRDHKNNKTASSPTLLWHKKHSTLSTRAADDDDDDQHHQIKKRRKHPHVLRIRPDKHDGDGLRLSPWPPARALSRHFVRGGYGLYLSPYPPNYKGLGLTKLEHRTIGKHCHRNFNKNQINCIKRLVCER